MCLLRQPKQPLVDLRHVLDLVHDRPEVGDQPHRSRPRALKHLQHTGDALDCRSERPPLLAQQRLADAGSDAGSGLRPALRPAPGYTMEQFAIVVQRQEQAGEETGDLA